MIWRLPLATPSKVTYNGEHVNLTDYIKTVPDYPKPGILFRDITPLIADGAAFHGVIDMLAERYRGRGVTKIVGIEARGFIFATALAYALGVGFVPLRKPGKLPRATVAQCYALEYGVNRLQIHHDDIHVAQCYALEYGVDSLEIHADDMHAGDRVVLVDDLLATGGTVMAGVQLLQQLQAELVECSFVISLQDLGGEQRLQEAAIPYYTLC